MAKPDEINHAVNYAENLAAQRAERDRQLRELQERFLGRIRADSRNGE
jgi:hypothetical protein